MLMVVCTILIQFSKMQGVKKTLDQISVISKDFPYCLATDDKLKEPGRFLPSLFQQHRSRAIVLTQQGKSHCYKKPTWN